MTRRSEPVVNFAERPGSGPLVRVMDTLSAVLGKMTGFCDVAMLLEIAGHTVTNAASGAGTALPLTRTWVNFGDAGVDNVRLTVRGNNSVAGSVVVTVHDVTKNVELCRVSVTGATITTYAGTWTAITPTGADQEIEVRVIGDGAADPVLYAVHLQGRTVQART